MVYLDNVYYYDVDLSSMNVFEFGVVKVFLNLGYDNFIIIVLVIMDEVIFYNVFG